MTEEREVAEMLRALILEDTDEGFFEDARHFDECGVLTDQEGLIVEMENGRQFQISILRYR